jgi:hypothetical protein
VIGEGEDRTIAVPGRPDVIVIGDTEDRVVRYAILRRLTSDGAEVWRAAPPNGAADGWISDRVEGGDVVARSWSSYTVRLHLDTGAERERLFTK